MLSGRLDRACMDQIFHLILSSVRSCTPTKDNPKALRRFFCARRVCDARNSAQLHPPGRVIFAAAAHGHAAGPPVRSGDCAPRIPIRASAPDRRPGSWGYTLAHTPGLLRICQATMYVTPACLAASATVAPLSSAALTSSTFPGVVLMRRVR